jgi:ERCC4-type nuclease
MVSLHIDNRENELILLLEGRVKFSKEQLEIGDIIIKKNDEIVLIIERKSISDLKASICDGRLREQKARMVENVNRQRIMYLIEGNLSRKLTDKVSGMPVSTLIGGIINIQLRDNIKVYKTTNIKETVEFVIKLMDKFEKDGDTFFKTESSDGITASEYSATLKTRKKDNMTPVVWFNAQLTLIPQITDKISSEIIKIYPSVKDLMHAYENLTDDNARGTLLSDITYPIKNDKIRRVGDKASSRIYHMFYGLI